MNKVLNDSMPSEVHSSVDLSSKAMDSGSHFGQSLGELDLASSTGAPLRSQLSSDIGRGSGSNQGMFARKGGCSGVRPHPVLGSVVYGLQTQNLVHSKLCSNQCHSRPASLFSVPKIETKHWATFKKDMLQSKSISRRPLSMWR